MQDFKIAFLGVGLMGRAMIARLVQHGYVPQVWNRTPEKAAALSGVVVAATVAAALHDADIVISMLADGTAVDAVIEQNLGYLRSGMLWLDMSSTRPDQARAFHELLRQRGVAFVDAPVSGGVLGAEQGTLAIMAGAATDDYARAEPLLQVFGRPTRVGPPGAGQLAKLCNQLIVGGTINLVAEALLLAQAGGADPAAVRTALRGGFADSKILEVHGQRMLERNFIPGGKVATQAKDMRNILAAAHDARLDLPLTALVHEVYEKLSETAPQADHSAALLFHEARNLHVRLGQAQDKFG